AGLHERPFDAGRETGAASAAQTRGLHDVDDLARLHLERLVERRIAAAFFPAVERVRLLLSEMLGENGCLARMGRVREAHAISAPRESMAPCRASPIRGRLR